MKKYYEVRDLNDHLVKKVKTESAARLYVIKEKKKGKELKIYECWDF